MRALTDVELGRRSYGEQAWMSAFDALSRADTEEPLAAEDLELLAASAYMLGRDEVYVGHLERAHQAYLDRGDAPRAVRCGFWIGHSFLFRGEKARGIGWFARAQRVLENFGRDCVEQGYMLIPTWLEQMGSGKFEDAYVTTLRAAEIGERFADADLIWLARDDQARALTRIGRVKEGLRLANEVLVAATTNDLSPIVTGIVYCNTIAFCRAVHDVRHVREWTRAMTRWCERQPEMVAHNGFCLVHRAEIMLLGGDWETAMTEVRRVANKFTHGALNQLAVGSAFYCEGEALRLRGEFDAAEAAYREARQHGNEPQPGLALMRLAQGKTDSAAAMIRRIVGETTAPFRRAAMLPAYVQIMLASGSQDSAREASRELDETARRLDCEALDAMAASSRGAVLLAERRADEALIELRRAIGIWKELEAPYEVARVRELVGLACLALEDHDTAGLELDAARNTFRELGAVPDEERIGSLIGSMDRETGAADTYGLTERELQVLRLIATGKSNREIADALIISEHTVARHVQNIFGKLALSSRTAATAFAFSHQLV